MIDNVYNLVLGIWKCEHCVIFKDKSLNFGLLLLIKTKTIKIKLKNNKMDKHKIWNV